MYKWADSQHITMETMETKNWEGGINLFMVLDPKWLGYVPFFGATGRNSVFSLRRRESDQFYKENWPKTNTKVC
jgi:hypothetical protein